MNPLEVSPQEFHRIASLIVDLATDLLRELNTKPTFPHTSGKETQRLFFATLPEEGMGQEALKQLADAIAHSRPPSPRFFGYVLGSGEPISATADLLASVLNQNLTAWRSGPAAATIEQTVVRWLAEAIGCPGFTGSLTGGGSPANLMGLAMAREAKFPANEKGSSPAIVYASDQVHMSIGKSMALLGLGRENLKLIPSDNNFRISVSELQRAIQADRAAGTKAIAIIASAGTVNTGAIDPLAELADLAQRHNLWLHVDGAYGALAAIAAPEKFAGLDRADSLSLDPHKWLYQPLDCGCLLFRDPEIARTTFSHSGDYARALSNDPIEGFAFFEESMELSRRFRALKVWLSLRYHGLNAFREAIHQNLEDAQFLAEQVRRHAELELLAPVELSAVCFRWRGSGTLSNDDLNRRNETILRKIIKRGRVYISNASILGKFALRACIVNHRTKREDVEAVVEEVLAVAKER